MSCTLRATQPRGVVVPCSARLPPSVPPPAARARVIAFGRRNQSKSKKAGESQEDAPPLSPTSPPPPPSPAAASSPEAASSWGAESGSPGGEVAPGMTREYKAFGMRVIEANDSIKGPEDELDFWESDNFEKFGDFVQRWFLPAVAVAAVVIGIVAATTYDEGATVFQTTATGPQDLPDLIPAEKVLQGPPPS